MVVMMGSPGLMVEVAEGVGSAPTSVLTDPVFETGAVSLYLPAFHKLACRAEALWAKAGCQGWTRTNTERLNPDSESGLL